LNPLSLLLSSKTTTKGRVSNKKRHRWLDSSLTLSKNLRCVEEVVAHLNAHKLFLMLFYLFNTTKFNLIEISTRTLTLLNLEEKNIVLSLISLQFENLSWVEFSLEFHSIETALYKFIQYFHSNGTSFLQNQLIFFINSFSLVVQSNRKPKCIIDLLRSAI
jgi:hypothetical protein